MSSLSRATALTRRLGIEVPVLQAGMALVARPPLVAAVSEAGGLGVLGAAASPPEALARELAEVRSLTARPFGVDLAFPPALIATPPAVLAAVRLAPAEQGHGAPPPAPVRRLNRKSGLA